MLSLQYLKLCTAFLVSICCDLYERYFLQAEILYKMIEDCANLKGDCSEIVLDLFCGTGTIGLTLAKRLKVLSELGLLFLESE